MSDTTVGAVLDAAQQQTPEAIADRMFACRGGATFIIIRDGAVLMEKCPKKRSIFGAEWFIPGGKIESDETALDACLREAREELGVRIKQAVALPVMDGAPEGWPFFSLHAFLVLAYDGEIPQQALDADVPFAWVPVAEALRSPVPQVAMMMAGALTWLAAPPALEPEHAEVDAMREALLELIGEMEDEGHYAGGPRAGSCRKCIAVAKARATLARSVPSARTAAP